jgi:peptidoglycan hydrolase-like protein with peptidoglycan-binding domain
MRQLKYGIRGQDVRDHQDRLWIINILQNNPNGHFNHATEKAHYKYEKARGIKKPDKVAGAKSQTMLINEVKGIQKLMNENKWCRGIGVDGKASNAMIGVVKSAQKIAGLPITGQINGATHKVLKQKKSAYANNAKSVYTDNFKKEEFECGCGGKWCNGYNGIEMDRRIILVLEDIRAHYGKPVHITSGIRCQRYNDSLSNSIANSEHRLGRAVDIYIEGVSASSIIAYLKTIKKKYGLSYFYAITASAVHMDFQYD